MVVDGTSPGALGFSSLKTDFEVVGVASDITKEAKFVPHVKVNLANIKGDPNEVKPGKSAYTPIRPKGEYFDEYVQKLTDEVGHVNGYSVNPMMDFRFNMLVDNSQMNGLADGELPVSYSPFTEPTGWAGEVPAGAK